MALEQVGAIEAAERYRRISELKRQAKAQLVGAVIRERGELNLRAVSRKAGLYERTLYRWIEQEERSSNGRVHAAQP